MSSDDRGGTVSALYPLPLCVCPEGPYLGAQKLGTPVRCERCGFMTREQHDAIVAAHTTPLAAEKQRLSERAATDIADLCEEVARFQLLADSRLADRTDLTVQNRTLTANVERAERERDAYRKAKQENDDRFQLEAAEQRDRADRLERALADLRASIEGLVRKWEDATTWHGQVDELQALLPERSVSDE